MMTKDQLAVELKRIATTQISDITRAVKEGQKAIALNEVRDLARRLNLLADAFHPRPVPEPPEIRDGDSDGTAEAAGRQASTADPQAPPSAMKAA